MLGVINHVMVEGPLGLWHAGRYVLSEAGGCSSSVGNYLASVVSIEEIRTSTQTIQIDSNPTAASWQCFYLV